MVAPSLHAVSEQVGTHVLSQTLVYTSTHMHTQSRDVHILRDTHKHTTNTHIGRAQMYTRAVICVYATDRKENTT